MIFVANFPLISVNVTPSTMTPSVNLLCKMHGKKSILIRPFSKFKVETTQVLNINCRQINHYHFSQDSRSIVQLEGLSIS